MNDSEIHKVGVHRIIPEWINPVTIRGVGLVVGGLLVLVVPAFSQRLLLWVVVGVLVVVGATTLWAALRHRPVVSSDVAAGAVYIATGMGFGLFTSAAVTVMSKALGIGLAALGLTVMIRAARQRRSSTNWVFDVVRGAIYVAAGGVVVVLPAAIVSSLVLGVAAVALLLGAVTIAVGMNVEDPNSIGPGELGAFARNWLAERDLGDDMRDQVVDSLYFEKPNAIQKQVGFWVLLVLSVAIATLGVLADSTAVVIGAMLVAPLMTPIMGVSAGIVNGWLRRVSTSFATIAGGVLAAIGVSYIVSAWTPELIPLASNSQVLSRITPTTIDLMIAIAAGAAGAYATIDKRVSSSITGVAIAVALVPPLAVVGIMLQAGEPSDAFGAFLLFATNLVSIILVASVVFFVGGLAPIAEMRANADKMRTILGTVLLGAMIIMVPLVFTSTGIIVSATRQATAQEVTHEWLEPQEGMSVNRVTVKNDDVSVVVTGDGDLPDVGLLEESLEDAFGTDVHVTVEYFPSELVTSDN